MDKLENIKDSFSKTAVIVLLMLDMGFLDYPKEKIYSYFCVLSDSIDLVEKEILEAVIFFTKKKSEIRLSKINLY